MVNESDQQQQTAKPMGETAKSLGDNKSENSDQLEDTINNLDEQNVEITTSTKGRLNDLVADLCINGHDSIIGQKNHTNTQGIGGVYGDYTNIRATSGPIGLNENNFPFVGGCNMRTDNIEANYVSSNSTTTQNVQQQQPPPTQNSSFSFKHFLSSNNVPTAPSTTVTSLDPPANSTSTTSSNTVTSSRSLQTSTGARPKVPQSSSVSSTSISSLTVGAAETQSSATKMKRSPRFSSFDSQASLAEYAGSSSTAELPAEACVDDNTNATTDFSLYPDERERDRFQEWNFPTNAPTMTTNSTDYDRGSSYVPRSYSNYDMPRPQTSPRRRVGLGAATKDSRPTRLSLNSNQNPTTAAKLKLDLPLASNSIGNSSAMSTRKNVHSSRPTDFLTSNPLPGGAAAAAALPDFVQDHWMDSWYANDMNVNSPPSSPIPTFIEDLTGLGQASGSSIGHAAGTKHTQNTNRTLHLDNAPIPAPADRDDFNIGLNEPSSSSVGSKMLPDFLSDGPIIHSSQRLADVAAGLPSNSVGSPEESSINKQLSRLRSDNERLQRELNESRLVLNEQTLRANNLERQLMDQQRQQKTETEESFDSNKRKTAVQSLVTKLKQQIQQLTSEVKMLKRENELLREEGAVGGYSVQSCDSSYNAAAVSSTTRAAVIGNDITSVAGIRPSRQQQLSRDLRRAASNAEQNLKQLLAGVENLRQMAANIEKSETHVDYDASPDLFSDFIDECDDDYDKYPGSGPAL